MEMPTMARWDASSHRSNVVSHDIWWHPPQKCDKGGKTIRLCFEPSLGRNIRCRNARLSCDAMAIIYIEDPF